MEPIANTDAVWRIAYEGVDPLSLIDPNERPEVQIGRLAGWAMLLGQQVVILRRIVERHDNLMVRLKAEAENAKRILEEEDER